MPPAPKGTSRGERVRLKRSQDGQVAISFHAIPLDDLEDFLALVQAHLRELR